MQNQFCPIKTNKLFNCPVKVVSFNCPLMKIAYGDNDKHHYEGVDGEILLMLAERINFKISLEADKTVRWGTLYANGSSSGAMRKVRNTLNKIAHLLLIICSRSSMARWTLQLVNLQSQL